MKKCFMKIQFTSFSLKKCYILQQKFCCEIKVSTWLQTSSINYSEQILKIQKYQHEADWKDFWFKTCPHLEILNWAQKTQTSMHCWKKQLFLTKNVFFCWNTKEKSDLKFWCWALLSIMLDILQLCLIHKNHSSLNYCNLKSADQFCKFQKDFKKHLKIRFAAWLDSKHWNPT